MGNNGRVKRLMQGNEACAEAAVAAGVRFFAGYPITPATEITEIMSDLLPRAGGTFIQMEDELASIAAVIGASLAGEKALTATSGPGFTLMQENLGFAAMCEIPCVVVNVQRGGPSTGLATLPAQGDVMQTKWGTHGDHPVITLAPSSVAETYELTVKAVNFAEQLRNPVVLLSDAFVGHVREVVEVPHPESLDVQNRSVPSVPPAEYLPFKPVDESLVPPLAEYGKGYRFHVTSNVHDETGFPAPTDHEVAQKLVARLLGKIQVNRKELVITSSYCLEGAEVAVIAYGSVARSARRAVELAREAGMPVGLLKLTTLAPFPDEEVVEVLKEVRAVLVPEMNAGQILMEVRAASQQLPVKIVGLNQYNGLVIKPGQILSALREEFA